jgi:hypothetical protein
MVDHPLEEAKEAERHEAEEAPKSCNNAITKRSATDQNRRTIVETLRTRRDLLHQLMKQHPRFALEQLTLID